MTPDAAVGSAAWDAMDLVRQYREHGGEGDPEQLLGAVSAVIEGMVPVGLALAREAEEPGSVRLEPDVRQLLEQVKACASGALLIYSLFPGIADLPEPEDS